MTKFKKDKHKQKEKENSLANIGLSLSLLRSLSNWVGLRRQISNHKIRCNF